MSSKRPSNSINWNKRLRFDPSLDPSLSKLLQNEESDEEKSFYEDSLGDLICSQIDYSSLVPKQTSQIKENTARCKPLDESNREIAERDGMVGEIIILRQKLEAANNALRKEKEIYSRLERENLEKLEAMKDDYEKRIKSLKVQLEFNSKEYLDLKMKIKNVMDSNPSKICLQPDNSLKWLPDSVPILIHRILNFDDDTIPDIPEDIDE